MSIDAGTFTRYALAVAALSAGLSLAAVAAEAICAESTNSFLGLPAMPVPRAAAPDF